MKQIFTILAMIAAILATILSVLPLSNLAIFPAIAALIFVFIAFYLSKKSGHVKKTIQFIFLLTIISLAITTYKALFNTSEITNTQELKKKEDTSKKEAIEELEDLNLDDISVDE